MFTTTDQEKSRQIFSPKDLKLPRCNFSLWHELSWSKWKNKVADDNRDFIFVDLSGSKDDPL